MLSSHLPLKNGQPYPRYCYHWDDRYGNNMALLIVSMLARFWRMLLSARLPNIVLFTRALLCDFMFWVISILSIFYTAVRSCIVIQIWRYGASLVTGQIRLLGLLSKPYALGLALGFLYGSAMRLMKCSRQTPY